MWPRTAHDKSLVPWVPRHPVGCNVSVRYVDFPLHMSVCIRVRASHIDDDEVWIGALHALVHVPTIRLEREQAREVTQHDVMSRSAGVSVTCVRMFRILPIDTGPNVCPEWVMI